MVHTVQRALACGRVSLSASPVKMSGKTFRFIEPLHFALEYFKLMWVDLGGESARINQNTIPAELRHCERFLQVACKLALHSL